MYLTKDNEYIAFLDACVLVPMSLCDTLLRMAEEPALFQIRWSEAVLAEVERALLKQSRYTPAQVERRLHAMRSQFPEAAVKGYDRVTVPHGLPDPNDAHVVAAALAGHCHAIITDNLGDFPAEALSDLGLAVQSPDEFLVHQLTLRPHLVHQKLTEQAGAIQRTLEQHLPVIAVRAPRFAAQIRHSFL